MTGCEWHVAWFENHARETPLNGGKRAAESAAGTDPAFHPSGDIKIMQHRRYSFFPSAEQLLVFAWLTNRPSTARPTKTGASTGRPRPLAVQSPTDADARPDPSIGRYLGVSDGSAKCIARKNEASLTQVKRLGARAV